LTRNRTRILAQVPLAELSDFQATLKSLTGGAGLVTLQLDHYENAPAAVQKSLEREFRPTVEELRRFVS
jgi:elongation factor G